MFRRRWAVVQVPRNRTMTPTTVETFRTKFFAWNFRRQCDVEVRALGLERIHHEVRKLPREPFDGAVRP